MMAQRPDRRGLDKKAYEKHLERLNNIKSAIDVSPPKTFTMPKRETDKVIFLLLNLPLVIFNLSITILTFVS